MDLTAKNEAYRSYLDQAKEAYSDGDHKRAKTLFLKAAEISNEITLSTKNIDLKQEYYRVTQTILEFVKKNCKIEMPAKSSPDVNGGLQTKTLESFPAITLEEALDSLNKMIGLESVKHQINRWVNQFQVFQLRQALNLKVPEMSYHMVFSGRPGTGKTTVARIVGQIYRALGILPKGHVHEVSRESLVAGYVGQTAIKTKSAIDQAIGGVLFIDEAQELYGEDPSDFGREAIGTIVKEMEDKRNKFAIVAAGYPNEIMKFIESNPGFKSRFDSFIYFEDYTATELYQIFAQLCAKNDYHLDDNASRKLLEYFRNIDSTNKDFANGRTVRKLFEKIVTNHSQRVFPLLKGNSASSLTDDMKYALKEITETDLQLETK